MNTLAFFKKLKYFFVLFIGLLSGIPLFAQNSNLQEMVSSLNSYSTYHLKEKVYLHTDRNYYLCGEILWFKAYVENAINNHPLTVSKVVYVELLNKEHDPVLQAKIAINNGNGNGSFSLPLTLETGNYELRAYTNWMKNDSAFHFFKKIITVVNTTQNLDPNIVHNHFRYEAQFFPEGGNLVNGLPSVVAFKINDNYGKGVDANGVIVDQSNDTVLHFQTSHFGMGKFMLTPEPGKNYYAIISFSDKSSLVKDLPKAYSNGMVMQLEDEGSDVKISVASSGQPSSEIYLIAQNNRIVVASQSARTENGNAVFLIKKNDLKDGLCQITLFNENRQPVCERLYFKRPTKKLLIEAKADESVYKKRIPVNISLSTSDESSKLLAGNLSVSVYRMDSLHQPGHKDIF
jgi:hypothetical protein